ncbi:MAG: V-type ATP synthase subunit F [Candidatus Hydrothermota bacterium]|nr:MAG: V-type ATP synthase subunit F [Candidatus Hydrothermae bacterium]
MYSNGENKIGCVGEYDVVFPFKSMNFDIVPVTDEDMAFNAVKEFVDKNYAVILVQEKFLTAIHDLIMETYARPIPAIVAIPGPEGSLGIALDKVRDVIRRAVGKDLLGD